jgi:hypothetical protein
MARGTMCGSCIAFVELCTKDGSGICADGKSSRYGRFPPTTPGCGNHR